MIGSIGIVLIWEKKITSKKDYKLFASLMFWVLVLRGGTFIYVE